MKPWIILDTEEFGTISIATADIKRLYLATRYLSCHDNSGMTLTHESLRDLLEFMYPAVEDTTPPAVDELVAAIKQPSQPHGVPLDQSLLGGVLRSQAVEYMTGLPQAGATNLGIGVGYPLSVVSEALPLPATTSNNRDDDVRNTLFNEMARAIREGPTPG